MVKINTHQEPRVHLLSVSLLGLGKYVRNLTLIEFFCKSQVKFHVDYKIHSCYDLWRLNLPPLLQLGTPYYEVE